MRSSLFNKIKEYFNKPYNVNGQFNLTKNVRICIRIIPFITSIFLTFNLISKCYLNARVIASINSWEYKKKRSRYQIVNNDYGDYEVPNFCEVTFGID